MTSQASDITLYTGQTPNGIKVSILLEELGLPYKAQKIDMKANEQKSSWFLDINPNGRIPAITDSHPTEAGKKVRVFESGAVMQYLVSRYDKDYRFSFPVGTAEWTEMTSWVMWQMGGLGPMQGQSNHFNRYAPTKIAYAADRYINETKRLYSVLDTHLSKVEGDFLVADKYTIADMICWGWVSAGGWAGVDINEFPALKAWEERLWARPALKRGANVPEPYRMKEILGDKDKMREVEERGREVILKGMEEDRRANEARTSKV